MIYVGLDISSKSLVLHGMNEKKKTVFTGEIPPNKRALRKAMLGLGAETRLVVFEASNQLKWIAQCLRKIKGVHIHVVHPNELKWITQSNGKTDKADARKLAELARGNLLPRKVHIAEGVIRELRELISARNTAMRKRVSLTNCLRSYALQEGCSINASFLLNPKWPELLPSLKITENLKVIFTTIMPAVDALRDAEEEFLLRIKDIEDDRLDLVQTIPGIGPLVSATIVSALDNVERFENKKCVAKYGALAPTIYQSGNVTRLGHINFDGRREIRRVLLQSAHIIIRMKSPAAKPLRDFYDRIKAKRGKKIATIALCRKVLTIAYGILKTGNPYDPFVLTPNAV
jgi:transposase